MTHTKQKRPGRPAKPNMIAMSIKLDKELAELVRTQPDKYSVTIEKALKLYFRALQPENKTINDKTGSVFRYC
jgi:hypothetical protein